VVPNRDFTVMDSGVGLSGIVEYEDEDEDEDE
jgi:hypothetical protein